MRVYVLGAGASIHAKYPLAAALGTSLAAWIETLPPEHNYRFRLSQIVDGYGPLDNFEAVLADLMTCAPRSIAAGFPPVMRQNLITDVTQAIREYFDTIRTGPASLYDRLAHSLRPDDMVLTYNYDLGVERALAATGLWDIKTGYGFPIGDVQQRSRVEVLKLHGSTNWSALLLSDRTGDFVAKSSLAARPVLFARPDQEYLGFPDFVDPLCAHLNTAPTLPVMIMPALPKEFYFATGDGREWEPFWDCLWHRAQLAIEEAEDLVIIGYSLPAADGRARDLLLRTINKSVRLTICCGGATTSLEQQSPKPAR
jgi:hypothetical protein